MQLEELITLLNAEKAQAVTIFQNGKCLLTHARRCYPFDSIADLERCLTRRDGAVLPSANHHNNRNPLSEVI